MDGKQKTRTTETSNMPILKRVVFVPYRLGGRVVDGQRGYYAVSDAMPKPTDKMPTWVFPKHKPNKTGMAKWSL